LLTSHGIAIAVIVYWRKADAKRALSAILGDPPEYPKVSYVELPYGYAPEAYELPVYDEGGVPMKDVFVELTKEDADPLGVPHLRVSGPLLMDMLLVPVDEPMECWGADAAFPALDAPGFWKFHEDEGVLYVSLSDGGRESDDISCSNVVA
jgi:hypothetical protein